MQYAKNIRMSHPLQPYDSKTIKFQGRSDGLLTVYIIIDLARTAEAIIKYM